MLNAPSLLTDIRSAAKQIGFTMPADDHVGALLRTLVSSKTAANILELGTGIGWSLSWMVDGMDQSTHLTTIDNDPKLSAIAQSFYGTNSQVEIICADAEQWILEYQEDRFDLIFADAWPGKYSVIEKTLDLLNIGGIYVVDDMSPQPNWSEEHKQKAKGLITYLESRSDLHLVKLDWASGVVLASAKSSK